MSVAAAGPERARTRGRYLAFVALLSVGEAGPVLAQPGSPAVAADTSERGPAEGGIEMTVVGTAADLQRVRRAVESRALAGPGARWARVPRFEPMEVLRGERDPGPTVRCWIDITEPRRVRLYFAARSGRQFLVRDVEMSGSFDEVDGEALSQVIELSVAALLENERAGLTRAQAQALLAGRETGSTRAGSASPISSPARPPSPSTETATVREPEPEPRSTDEGAVPVPPSSEPELDRAPRIDSPPVPRPPVGIGPAAGAFYRAHALGRDLPVVHGPGLVAAWGWAQGQTRALGGWATGQYQLPFEELGPDIGVRLEGFALRTGVAAHFLAAAAAAPPPSRIVFAGWTARVGAGADLVRVTPRPGTSDPSASLTGSRWSPNFLVEAAVAATWAVGRRLALALVLSGDVLPIAVHYDLAVAGQTSSAFAPWRVRPGVALELSFR